MTHRRYLDLDLPPLFALQIGEEGNEWGVFCSDWFGRADDGSYVCAGHGGSPVFFRARRRDGLRFRHVDGGGIGRRHSYRLRIVDPSEVEGAGALVSESAPMNVRAPGPVGRIARAQRQLLATRLPARELVGGEPAGSGRAGVPAGSGGAAVYAVYVDAEGWAMLNAAGWDAMGVVFSPGAPPPPPGAEPDDRAGASEPQPDPPEGGGDGDAEAGFGRPRDPHEDPLEDPFASLRDAGQGARVLSHRSREPIYLGRSTGDPDADLRVHFTDGQTPRSPLRRALAALLGWAATTRWDWQPSEHTRDGTPTPAGVEHFTLTPRHDAELTAWMLQHLSVGLTDEPDAQTVGDFDALVDYFRPPLLIEPDDDDDENADDFEPDDPLAYAAWRALGNITSIIGWSMWPEDERPLP